MDGGGGIQYRWSLRLVSASRRLASFLVGGRLHLSGLRFVVSCDFDSTTPRTRKLLGQAKASVCCWEREGGREGSVLTGLLILVYFIFIFVGIVFRLSWEQAKEGREIGSV